MIAQAPHPASAAVTHRAAPIRGTQSFVGVMASVWRRPSLVAIEVLWRWAAGAPLLAVCAWEFLRLRGSVTLDTRALEAMTVFKPVQAGLTISSAVHAVVPVVLPILLWLIPAAFVLRCACAALGRAALLRRLAAQAHPRRGLLFVLSALRAATLLLVLALWGAGVRWANNVSIIAPAARGEEPNVVLLSALVVFGTLALFVAWALTIWAVDAVLFSANDTSGSYVASLRRTFANRALRGHLIEMDLVMGIVKVALIVLAMVFSACPLPFESVESVTFLTWWCIGVAILYLIASDFFHVVRAAACVAMNRLDSAPSLGR